ncbi:hypothetical protein IG631_03658 [Alternaria alternata]|nr:hypothetical protein IG631_03658 [Alternaria alternata]
MRQLKRCRFFQRELSEGLAGYIAGTAMARACRDAMQALRSGLLYELPGCSRGGCWGHTARLRAPSLLGREKIALLLCGPTVMRRVLNSS